MRMFFVLILGVMLLAGCGGQLIQPQNMSPEQLTAWAKVKDATLGCARGLYAGVSVVATYANIDKGIPAGVTIDTDCKITFTNPAK
jgi:hypothetical protein